MRSPRNYICCGYVTCAFYCFSIFTLVKANYFLHLSFQQFLKEILNELCVYNKRGTNQGTYELKPEYKKSVDETGAEQ